MISNMLVPNLKSHLSQQVRSFSYAVMHSHTIYEWRVGVICYFTTVGFIDNELVGANHGIDDLTSVSFPCYNVRVSNKPLRRLDI